MAKLLIKFPTRGRPEKFRRMLTRYRDHLSGRHTVRFVITCDWTDRAMNNRRMRSWLDAFAATVDLVYHFGWSFTKIQAVNADLKRESADVLLLASDDMNPVTQGFDAIIFDEFARHFPDYRGAIKFNDGFRDDNLMTYAVLGWPLYRAFGYIYHPRYLSLYCDKEQTRSCEALGCLAISDVCLLRHEWTPEHFDFLHKRNENRWMYWLDGRVYARREKHQFDIDRVREALRATTV